MSSAGTASRTSVRPSIVARPSRRSANGAVPADHGVSSVTCTRSWPAGMRAPASENPLGASAEAELDLPGEPVAAQRVHRQRDRPPLRTERLDGVARSSKSGRGALIRRR